MYLVGVVSYLLVLHNRMEEMRLMGKHLGQEECQQMDFTPL
jgi:hypothetical protein